MRSIIIDGMALLTFALCLSFVPAAAFAASSVGSKTCAQLKNTVKAKRTVVLGTRRGTKRFVQSAFYCDQEEQLAWQVVQSRSGKCYLHICRSYRNYR